MYVANRSCHAIAWLWRVPKLHRKTVGVGSSKGRLQVRGLVGTDICSKIYHSTRHIDSAQAYKNEAECGAAVAESGLKREEVFISECK